MRKNEKAKKRKPRGVCPPTCLTPARGRCTRGAARHGVCNPYACGGAGVWRLVRAREWKCSRARVGTGVGGRGGRRPRTCDGRDGCFRCRVSRVIYPTSPTTVTWLLAGCPVALKTLKTSSSRRNVWSGITEIVIWLHIRRGDRVTYPAWR